MAADDFFNRWSKRKSATVSETDDALTTALPVPTSAELPVPDKPVVASLPTLEDVANLTRDSDFSVFMAQGVDENVKRSAMKKLFSDPRFNVMDGLDTYIEDYTKFKPITPAILASLNHAKALLDPLSQLKSPLMRLLETPQEIEAPSENTTPCEESVEPAKEARGDASAEKHYAEEQGSGILKTSDVKTSDDKSDARDA